MYLIFLSVNLNACLYANPLSKQLLIHGCYADCSISLERCSRNSPSTLKGSLGLVVNCQHVNLGGVYHIGVHFAVNSLFLRDLLHPL